MACFSIKKLLLCEYFLEIMHNLLYRVTLQMKYDLANFILNGKTKMKFKCLSYFFTSVLKLSCIVKYNYSK